MVHPYCHGPRSHPRIEPFNASILPRACKRKKYTRRCLTSDEKLGGGKGKSTMLEGCITIPWRLSFSLVRRGSRVAHCPQPTVLRRKRSTLSIGHRRHSSKLSNRKPPLNSTARRSRGRIKVIGIRQDCLRAGIDSGDHADYASNGPAADLPRQSLVRSYSKVPARRGRSSSVILHTPIIPRPRASARESVSQSQLVIFLFPRYRSVAPECCKRESVGDERSQGGVPGRSISLSSCSIHERLAP